MVEGYFDAIALHQAGRPQYRRDLRAPRSPWSTRGSCARLSRGVALTYDGDAAGQEAMLRSLGVLLAEGLDVAVVDLPAGDDPDTLVRRDGLEGWTRVRAIRRTTRWSSCSGTCCARGGGGDPRERALQVLVRMLGGRARPDPAAAAGRAREPGLRDARGRASRAPCGCHAAAPTSRSARWQRRGAASPPGSERRSSASCCRRCCTRPRRSSARAGRCAPEHSRDGGARASSREALWRGDDALGAEGEGAALARELLADETEGFDWDAEAIGAHAQMLQVTGARAGSAAERRSRPGERRGATKPNRLMLEIDRISKQILELKHMRSSPIHGG